MADALASGASVRKDMEVRLLSRPPLFARCGELRSGTPREEECPERSRQAKWGNHRDEDLEFGATIMERERITITIRQDLLRQVDSTIDHVRVRNRSHAIEALVSRSLGAQLSTAVVLAGGKGLKMRPFTYELPKSMIPVHDQPILEHILELLRSHNVRHAILLTDYLGQKIEQHFGDGKKFGIQITYVRSKDSQGTAGALLSAQALLTQLGQPFYLLHGDVLAELNLSEMAEFHNAQGRKATMALTSVADPSAYGAVKLSGTAVVDFHEKPLTGPAVSRLINAGVYILEPSLLTLLPASKKVAYLEEDLFPPLIDQRQLTGYLFEGKWFDISTPETYERALKEW